MRNKIALPPDWFRAYIGAVAFNILFGLAAGILQNVFIKVWAIGLLMLVWKRAGKRGDFNAANGREGRYRSRQCRGEFRIARRIGIRATATAIQRALLAFGGTV